jgi:heterodisulfide reductase subunit C
VLGSLEKKILSVLRLEQKTTAKAIFDILTKEGMQMQYVTVNTVLSRMAKRGLVKRTKEPFRGRYRYIYEYVEVKEQLIADFLEDMSLLFGEEGIQDLKFELDTGKKPPPKPKPQPKTAPEPTPVEGMICLSREQTQDPIIKKVEDISGQNVMACYHCGKCSAGCPMASVMDLQPNQVIRMVQLGQVDEALESKTIWLCASCYTCVTRCPKGVDLSKIMEALRVICLRKGKDHIQLSKPGTELPEDAPQQLLVSGSRKYTG